MGDDQDQEQDQANGDTAPDRWAGLPRWAGGAAVVVLGLAVAGFALAPQLTTEPTLGALDANPTIAAAQLARYAADHAAWQAAVSATRTNVLAAVAGVGALITIVISLRNSNTALRNAATQARSADIASQTLETTQRTFQVTERGHQTGRYTAAIEQLGNSDSIAIRLGGIYALEQLARDSGRPGDQATVVEVLSAFVRVTSRTPRPASPGPVGAPTIPAATVSASDEPEADVQAAVTVLGRLPHLDGVARADLTVAQLTGVQLAGADLTSARLCGATLTGAYLGGATLTGADLGEADLTSARLGGATLTGADLLGADLTGADLGVADLTGAYLGVADLTGANLGGATLTGADLSQVDLPGAYLGGATLTGANLGRATLTGAYLGEADLTGADLGVADLTGADLYRTVGAELSEAQWAMVRCRPDGSPGTPAAGAAPSPEGERPPEAEGGGGDPEP